MAMLVEETDKLFNELLKELVDEIISDCVVSTSSQSLPLLPGSGQEDFPLKGESGQDVEKSTSIMD
jgi:hypothetical protein